jgi:hypothetical protein
LKPWAAHLSSALIRLAHWLRIRCLLAGEYSMVCIDNTDLINMFSGIWTCWWTCRWSGLHIQEDHHRQEYGYLNCEWLWTLPLFWFKIECTLWKKGPVSTVCLYSRKYFTLVEHIFGIYIIIHSKFCGTPCVCICVRV